ncbi:MAG: FAD-dependent oxidoreductase [Myxococcota bacterium]
MRTVIVGGGLSGLSLAERLEARGHDYRLLQARDRFGGRIMTKWRDGAAFDLGPAWFWPGQPPARGGPYALFGFVGVHAHARRDEAALRHALREQLGRLFGARAAEPQRLLLKDWADDPLTATQADTTPQYAHPAYGLPDALEDLWEGHVNFAGTEVARQFGGFLEGALEAAEAVFARLTMRNDADV